MTKPSNSQSLKRFQESVGQLFSSNTGQKRCLVLKSSSDRGVIRNGGRNGARFAPQSFLSTFKKFSQCEELRDYSFREVEVASQEEEQSNFKEAQHKEAERISNAIESLKENRLIHIGGGHDHAYPLLLALSKTFSKVVVINIDAHADTRTDEDPHSGTPFRQFSETYQGEFHIFQIGLHPFANSFSTLSPLKKGNFHNLWKNDINSSSLDETFETIRNLIDEKTLVFFSLDADALSGSEVPGVSAVNPRGLSCDLLMTIWKRYQELPMKHEKLMGIYELNPLYDSLGSLSMRTIGSFVFESLKV